MCDLSHSLGIDIGGTRIKAVAVSSSGEMLGERILPTAERASELASVVKQVADELATASGPIGICAPGLASRDNRTIASMRGRMQAVEGLKWRNTINRDVWVLNDGHAAAIGEFWLGAARDTSNVVLLTLGTGVGGGVICNGHLLQGAAGRAGHLGHVTLDCNGRPDIVGMPGSLEDCIGNHNVAERSGGRCQDTRALFEATATGDPHAADCLQKSIRGLAVGIASFINAFDPEIIVLGGGIAECGAALFDPLRKWLDQVEWRPNEIRVPVVPAALGELAGAIGAARFAMLKHFEEPS